MTGRHRYISVLALGAALAASPAWAQDKKFDVSRQPATTGLPALARQGDVQVMVSESAARGREIQAVHGVMNTEEALRRSLAGTGLRVKPINDHTYAVLAMASEMRSDLPETPSAVIPAAAPDPAPEGGLSDIVVTAEKRLGTAQTTPIAMNVFDRGTLDRNGVHDIQSLAEISPSISFAENESYAIITIRGVSSQDYSEVGDPAVAVSTDGFYMQRPYGLNASLFDLERIEVLRGPQGTLYGRNATAGAINIITAKPTDQFGGYLSLTYGNYNTINTEGAINIPLSNTLAVRASFSTQNHDGYLKLAPAPNGNDADSQAARIEAQWTPTDRFKVLLTGSWLHEGGIGAQGVGIPYAAAADGSNSHAQTPIPGSDHVFPENTDGFLRLVSTTFQWNFAYRFDPFTIAYLGGYNNMAIHRETDLDGDDVNSDGFRINEMPTTINNELRLSSNGHGPFKWQLGAFSFEEKSSEYTTLQTFSTAGEYDWGIFDYPEIHASSVAAFGQASYELVHGLAVEGGIRYTSDTKHRAGVKTFYGGAGPDDEHETSSAITWHGALNWQATPDNLVYAKADKGYKAGGFNNDSLYEPEYLYSYEAGTKNYFLGRKVQLNLDGFYYNYRNMQVSQFVGGLDRSIITNAGKARIYGIEGEQVYQFTPADRLDLSEAWLHARFVQFSTVDANNVNQNLAGNMLPQAPNWAITGGYQHTWGIFTGTLTSRVQFQYQSSSYLSAFNYGDSRQDAYTKTDVSVDYKDQRGWDIQAFARNLENRVTLTWAGENNSYGSNYYQFSAPRTYGVRLRYDFR